MKITAIATLALAGSAFCLDEYLPVEKSKLQVDVGYNLLKPSGAFDSSGKSQDFVSGESRTYHSIPLQLKYGIIPGLDVEVLWAFNIQSMSSPAIPGLMAKMDSTAKGFGQPDIALKYALMDIGVGAFVDFTVPFATGDFSDPYSPAMALSFGAVYTKLFVPQFNLTASASYRLNFEGDATVFDTATFTEVKGKAKAGNVFSVYAKPEFRFNQFGGAYLGLKYAMIGESQESGKSISGTDGYAFTLVPGWNATWLPNVSTEVNVPYTLAGKNTTSEFTAPGWGISAKVHVTLPK